MKSQKWKADEMEMTINFKSIRIAFVFLILALFAYCMYGVIIMNELLTVPFVIMCASCSLFFISKLYLTKVMTQGNCDEE